MRLMRALFGRRRSGFYQPDRTLRDVFGSATAMASARDQDPADGTGSLDLLVAATAAKPVAKVLREIGIDPAAVAQRANATRRPGSEPGLTADAQRVVEAVSQRSLAHRRDMTSLDLLIALAQTPGPAREVLLGLGLDEQRLAAIIT